MASVIYRKRHRMPLVKCEGICKITQNDPLLLYDHSKSGASKWSNVSSVSSFKLNREDFTHSFVGLLSSTTFVATSAKADVFVNAH